MPDFVAGISNVFKPDGSFDGEAFRLCLRAAGWIEAESPQPCEVPEAEEEKEGLEAHIPPGGMAKNKEAKGNGDGNRGTREGSAADRDLPGRWEDIQL